MADAETLSTPPRARLRLHQEEEEALEEAQGHLRSPHRCHRRRSPTNVTVDASLTGGSSYPRRGRPRGRLLPSGYDPSPPPPPPPQGGVFPRTRLFRHEKHPTWVDLVVRSPGGGPDFVGRSYAGASGTLRVVPIAAKKILRLEPHLEVQRPAHSQHSEVASEAAGNDELKVQDLTMMYGTKMDRDKDNKWRSLNEQRNDPSAFEDIDLGGSETAANTIDSQEPVLTRNIPPYDPTGEDKERFAWILSYIQHLLSLLARNGSMSKRQRKERNENQTNRGPATPQAVYRRLLLMFTEPGSSVMSTEKNELLINYILVLTLFADDFRSNPNDICEDLKMTRQKLKPYYDQLGCKSVSEGAFKGSVMTLPAPLKFPKDVTRKRRRQ
ncbi:unnamed protein product [Miscanthus lutarioriparius]|uniref:Uncharacterized protein n=1 Tax=Miscanthus lutarioriparius TaxID=422564 RepID=A0A811QA59_9POAL|nr:unnamed protein product [Miscanthus lutarioriparius]